MSVDDVSDPRGSRWLEGGAIERESVERERERERGEEKDGVNT